MEPLPFWHSIYGTISARTWLKSRYLFAGPGSSWKAGILSHLSCNHLTSNGFLTNGQPYKFELFHKGLLIQIEFWGGRDGCCLSSFIQYGQEKMGSNSHIGSIHPEVCERQYLGWALKLGTLWRWQNDLLMWMSVFSQGCRQMYSTRAHRINWQGYRGCDVSLRVPTLRNGANS